MQTSEMQRTNDKGADTQMSYTFEFFSVFGHAVSQLAPILLTFLALITVNGLLIGRLEGWRPGDALYHAFINATTVGYGDMHPRQGTARFLAILNAFMGLLFTGLLIAAAVFAVQITLSVPL